MTLCCTLLLLCWVVDIIKNLLNIALKSLWLCSFIGSAIFLVYFSKDKVLKKAAFEKNSYRVLRLNICQQFKPTRLNLSNISMSIDQKPLPVCFCCENVICLRRKVTGLRTLKSISDLGNKKKNLNLKIHLVVLTLNDILWLP